MSAIAMAPQITGVSIVCSTVFQAHIIENIKAPRHWPLWGESTGGFPSQRARNAENVSIWWRHYVQRKCRWPDASHASAMKVMRQIDKCLAHVPFWLHIWLNCVNAIQSKVCSKTPTSIKCNLPQLMCIGISFISWIKVCIKLMHNDTFRLIN